MCKRYSLLFIFYFFVQVLKADIYDYIYKYADSPTFSNYGTVGIIQNPNARFLSEGSIALSWTHNEPYLRGSIIASPFNWMEASFQYTDINNQLYSNNAIFSGSQSLKDKSFDIKVRLIEENGLFPQVAVGLRDIGGTGLFASEYIVASKFIHNLDLTFGIGWGNLSGNKINNPLTQLSDRFKSRDSFSGKGGELSSSIFSGDAGYFFGAELILPYLKGMRFKIEYDGTNYGSEGRIPIEQSSKFNLGFSYPFSNNFRTKIFITRDQVINFGFSYNLNLGRRNPLSFKKNQRVQINNSEIIKSITSRSDENLYKASLLYLQEEGISLQNANASNDQLHIAYSHSKYRSPSLAVGRAFNIINQIAPNSIKEIKLSEVNAGLGIYSATISRDIYNRYQEQSTHKILEEYSFIESFKYNSSDFEFNPSVKYPAIFFSSGPELVNQLGGPDGFFFGDLKWNLESEILFIRNLTLNTKLSYGLYDNMDELKLESDSILPHVRTDIVQYLKQSRNFSIQRLQLNYYTQKGKNLFIKYSGGIFESMFAGYGFEALFKPFNKNYALGIDLWSVRKRDFNQRLDLLNYKTQTGHVTFYYREPNSNILFSIKGGRYLAKDSGFTFDISRNFRSGLRMGAFFSLTDISKEEFGEGSFDKGFYFWIPVEIFSSRYFKRTFGWGLRPVTRDGAQSLIYGYPLWGVTDNSSSHNFHNTFDDIYK